MAPYRATPKQLREEEAVEGISRCGGHQVVLCRKEQSNDFPEATGEQRKGDGERADLSEEGNSTNDHIYWKNAKNQQTNVSARGLECVQNCIWLRNGQARLPRKGCLANWKCANQRIHRRRATPDDGALIGMCNSVWSGRPRTQCELSFNSFTLSFKCQISFHFGVSSLSLSLHISSLTNPASSLLMEDQQLEPPNQPRRSEGKGGEEAQRNVRQRRNPDNENQAVVHRSELFVGRVSLEVVNL